MDNIIIKIASIHPPPNILFGSGLLDKKVKKRIDKVLPERLKFFIWRKEWESQGGGG